MLVKDSVECSPFFKSFCVLFPYKHVLLLVHLQLCKSHHDKKCTGDNSQPG